MDKWDKVQIVQEMREYIMQHMEDEPLLFEGLYSHVGYSKRHADRIFKELLNKTPKEYVRSIKLSNSSRKLLEGEKTILDVALESGYNSHEGYARAFFDAFGIPPSQYKKGKNPIPLFIPYPIKGYYMKFFEKEPDDMEKKTCLCMITPIQKPKRKLILMYSKSAHDYFSYCEEMGCEWDGLFNSIPSKFDTAALLTLPPFLVKPGYGNIASGVEVPYEYDGEIPDHCEMIKLEPCEMLSFQSQPFQTEEEFFFLMGEVLTAAETFDAAAYGYDYADDHTPRFNFGGQEEKGARIAVPVRRIK